MKVVDAITLGRSIDGCSDVHLLGDDPIKLRVGGRPVTRDEVISSAEISAFIHDMLDEERRVRYERLGSCETMIPTKDGQVRLHVHRERRGERLAIRLTGRNIPEFSRLNLPEVISHWAQRSSGLILICGPAGSGKTTLLASLVNQINDEQRGAIVTIEHPVEYVHPQKGLYVSQMEVGRDTQSYGEGVRAALQSDPDVIVIGEVNDRDSANTMLQAAETGHLVLASVHSQNAVQALDRLASLLPEGAVRTQLVNCLIGVVALRLVPSLDGFVVPATEILVMNDATRKTIREDRTHQLRMTMDGDAGMHTLEKDLRRLIAEQQVDRREAERFAVYPDQV